jgi:hypothetical protein
MSTNEHESGIARVPLSRPYSSSGFKSLATKTARSMAGRDRRRTKNVHFWAVLNAPDVVGESSSSEWFRLDVLPLAIACAVEHCVANTLGLEGVSEGGMGGFARFEAFQEISDLVCE